MPEKPFDPIQRKEEILPASLDLEKITSFESYLERYLPEQYKSCVKTLTHLGLLELLPESESMGIRGIDGKEYPIPSLNRHKRSY